MFGSPGFWTAYAGFFAGMFEVMLLGRAIRLLGGLLGISTGEPKRFVPKRRLWAVPLLILHPACWGPFGILWLAYAVHFGHAASYWGWFVGTFFLANLVMWGFGLTIIFRAKRKRSRAAGA